MSKKKYEAAGNTEKFLKELLKSLDMKAKDVTKYSRAALNTKDFKNKIMCSKAGISIDRFLFINPKKDILEAGMDFNVYSPPFINLKYEQVVDVDFTINKESPLEETAKQTEEQRLKNLRKIYDDFFKYNFVAIVWLGIRDMSIRKHVFVFSEEAKGKDYLRYMENNVDAY